MTIAAQTARLDGLGLELVRFTSASIIQETGRDSTRHLVVITQPRGALYFAKYFVGGDAYVDGTPMILATVRTMDEAMKWGIDLLKANA
jgi:hypothetical protein